jgi:DNA repair exonuclease SbcCD ATPase subunit
MSIKSCWIEADQDFIDSYQTWKQALPQPLTQLGLPSLYHTKGSTHSTILKSQILNQSSLSKTGSNYRLKGDFFKYLLDLERKILDLQKQLDLLASKLQQEQLIAVRDNNQARRVEESLQEKMEGLIDEYRNAEVKHLENLRVLGETLQVVRGELSRVTIHALELEKKLADGLPKQIVDNKQPPVLSDNTAILSDNSEKIQATDNYKPQAENTTTLKSQITPLTSELASLKHSHNSLLDENQSLQTQIQDYKSQISRAQETEIAFKEQSIAIEKLRDALESGEMDGDSIMSMGNFYILSIGNSGSIGYHSCL